MITRRAVSISAIPSGLALALLGCSSTGTIDPTAVANALKSGCGIAIPLATITTIINAAIGATLETIINLICSSFKASVAASATLGAAPLAVGGTHDFVITVNGKTIPVQATVVEVK